MIKETIRNEVIKEYQKGIKIQDIAKKYSIGKSSVHNIINEKKVDKRLQRYTINEDFFKTWTHNMAYVLGFLITDGNVYISKKGYQFSFEQKNEQIIDNIRKSMSSNHPVRNYNNSEYYSLQINSREMVMDLIALEITPNKSKTIEIPNMPKEFYPSFIRGVFDGDGSVTENGRTVTIITASEIFANQLLKLLHNFNINEAYINTRKDKRYENTYYYFVKVGEKSSVLLFQELIYRNLNNELYLKEKKERFDKMVKKEEKENKLLRELVFKVLDCHHKNYTLNEISMKTNISINTASRIIRNIKDKYKPFYAEYYSLKE